MKLSITNKILKKHFVNNKIIPVIGEEIALKVDQTLTQDATGTLTYLQYQSIIEDKRDKKVRVKTAVSYVDHNTLQPSFENSDDHRFLKTIAAKYGIIFSPPGNGICHQLHLENFARPGEILIGSDSHTPTSSAVGMLAIGVGGLEVACAMAGEPLYLKMPKIVNINLTGNLKKFVSAKDIVLFLLKKFSVSGGINKIFEYSGSTLKYLSVYDRATITNMGAELGLTTSIFPSDDITKDFLKKQGRIKDFIPLISDEGCFYDEKYEINVSQIEPLAAQPHSPDNVTSIRELEGLKVNQVCIGSCTNSSLKDMIFLCKVLENKKVNDDVEVIVNPGSKQIILILEKMGLLENLFRAGVRVMEPVCGACIGQGQAPITSGVSVRTYNRNFEGRSGTLDAKVYLTSVETAAACAIFGEFVLPQRVGKYPKIQLPSRYNIYKPNFVYPRKDNVDIYYGPNIKPLPKFEVLENDLSLYIIKKFESNISTDDILPGGTKILSLRSNIPAISEYMFSRKDPELMKKIKTLKFQLDTKQPIDKDEKIKGFCIVAAENYGQGSSREHAAIVQRYNGINIIFAKSFARIHKNNLINFGVLPLEFIDKSDYDKLTESDILILRDVIKSIYKEKIEVIVKNRNFRFEVRVNLNSREKDIITSGGRLNYVKKINYEK